MNWIRAIPIFFILLLGFCSSAVSQNFSWNTDVANYKYSVIFGTSNYAAISSASTVVASATRITSKLTIPERTTSASINIREGTSVLMSTNAISGNMSNASVAFGIFDSHAEADFYVANHATVGEVPDYMIPIGDTSITYAPCNGKSLFSKFGYSTVPLTKSSKAIVAYVVFNATGTTSANTEGFTIEVLFNRE